MAGKHYDLDTSSLLGGENPSDITIASQKATKIYVDNQIKSMSNSGYSVESPQLIPVEGICTWTITHNLNSTNVICSLYLNNSEIEKDVDILSANSIQIQFYSADTLSAGTCKALILIKNGNNTSSGDTSNLANISLSNINNTAKDSIANFSAPDYANVIPFETSPTSGTDYISPVNGWLNLAMTHQNTSTGFIQVKFYTANNQTSTTIRGGFAGGLSCLFVPVRKGVKVQIEYNSLAQWYWAHWIPAYGNS